MQKTDALLEGAMRRSTTFQEHNISGRRGSKDRDPEKGASLACLRGQVTE